LAWLADALGRDTLPSDKVNLRFDTRPSEQKGFLADTFKANGWNVKQYIQPWLTLDGQLMDGSRYRIDIIEKHQRRVKWKRSSSGKSKRKTKTKSAMAFVIFFRPNKQAEIGPEIMAERLSQSLRLTDAARIGRIKPSGKGVRISGTLPDWTVDAGPGTTSASHCIALALLHLYQCFAPVTAEAPARAS
jgi:hypothetical protein